MPDAVCVSHAFKCMAQQFNLELLEGLGGLGFQTLNMRLGDLWHHVVCCCFVRWKKTFKVCAMHEICGFLLVAIFFPLAGAECPDLWRQNIDDLNSVLLGTFNQVVKHENPLTQNHCL